MTISHLQLVAVADHLLAAGVYLVPLRQGRSVGELSQNRGGAVVAAELLKRFGGLELGVDLVRSKPPLALLRVQDGTAAFAELERLHGVVSATAFRRTFEKPADRGQSLARWTTYYLRVPEGSSFVATRIPAAEHPSIEIVTAGFVSAPLAGALLDIPQGWVEFFNEQLATAKQKAANAAADEALWVQGRHPEQIAARSTERRLLNDINAQIGSTFSQFKAGTILSDVKVIAQLEACGAEFASIEQTATDWRKPLRPGEVRFLSDFRGIIDNTGCPVNFQKGKIIERVEARTLEILRARGADIETYLEPAIANTHRPTSSRHRAMAS